MDTNKTSDGQRLPPPLRILLAEDSPHDQLAFLRAFKKSQVAVEITVYERAEEALDKLEVDAEAFDLVVTDYKLPGMSGLDLCRELLDRKVPLPLVMLTGTGTEYLAVEALKAGVNDYIIKDPDGGYLELLPVVLPEVVQKRHDRLARQRVEEALLESEKKFRNIVECVPMGMHMYQLRSDDRLVFIGANPAADRILGVDNHQFVDKTIEEAFPELVETEVPGRYRIAALQGEAWQTDQIAYEENEIKGAFEVHAFQTSPGKMVAAFLDITDRKQAEQALQESEERFRSLSASSPVGIFQTDKEGRAVYVNDAMLSISGQTREECLGFGWYNGVHLEDRTALADEISRAVREKEEFQGEFRVLRPGGEVRWVSARSGPLRTDDGRTLGRVGMLVDITERVQAEEALRRRNRELELLNRASYAFNSTLELDGVLTTVLEEINQTLEVEASSVWLIDPKTDQLVCRQAAGPKSELVRGWRLAIDQGVIGWVTRHSECLIVSDTQTEPRHFAEIDRQTGLGLRSILAVPLRVKGDVIGVLEVVDTAIDRFTATDLTLVELLASAAATAIDNARLYEQARRDAETRSVLLREVNHRVKNNLTAILGLLSIERRHAAQAQSSAYQAFANDLTNRVEGLAQVHNLLSAARWQPLLLSDLVQRIIHTALSSVPSGKSVSVAVTPSPVQVTPDQAHNLALTVNELTTNTIKYGFQERALARITVTITHEGDDVECEFRDDGPGYAPDVLRLERQNVGMYLIQNLVCKGLRGEVDLRNDQGAVTTLRFKAVE